MSQYIGKTISLISNKASLCWSLENINADDATVALKSVRLFGTEGRMAAMGQPNLEVPPGVDVYDYVVFRGSDVKDLSVLDTPIDEVKPNIYRPPQQQQQQGATTGQYYSGPTSTSSQNGTLKPKLKLLPQHQQQLPLNLMGKLVQVLQLKLLQLKQYQLNQSKLLPQKLPLHINSLLKL